MKDDVLDYYELKQNYIANGRGELLERRLDRLLGVDMRPMRTEDTSSLNQEIQVGVFCGATCLSQYVQAHVGPDAATE